MTILSQLSPVLDIEIGHWLFVKTFIKKKKYWQPNLKPLTCGLNKTSVGPVPATDCGVSDAVGALCPGSLTIHIEVPVNVQMMLGIHLV